MKKLAVVLLVALVACWAFLAFVGVEPKDRRPGTKLAGTPAEIPADWSFVNSMDAAGEVHLETHPWYGVPFSVTTVIAEDNGALFVPSLYSDVMSFPGDKYWNKVVQSNPKIRLRVADKLYNLAVHPIADEAQFERAFAALARKYPFWAKQVATRETKPKFALLELKPR